MRYVDERPLPGHPFRRFRDAPVAAVARHVSEAVHPLQPARYKPARGNLAAVEARGGISGAHDPVQFRSPLSRRGGPRARQDKGESRHSGAGGAQYGRRYCCRRAERGTRGPLRHHRRHAVRSCDRGCRPFHRGGSARRQRGRGGAPRVVRNQARQPSHRLRLHPPRQAVGGFRRRRVQGRGFRRKAGCRDGAALHR